ncbi:DUF6473 family protein [Marivita sp. XM-24bin2]|jgi:hypothetical protein|uniref:DUF6473 family protein n=1 Tax=unclassified Marivita TaxID=2632480 RepID=UPI000D794146|nr:DUF6473 family protein [Marivita sp. XM-24bin2]MCR9111253.1 DUF6473 family protein [Paracoccaceae bacterium]PWL37205.1 MAG: hypothetical protein DCO97_01430 [Marivita sp. XM-24bin2]
MQISSARSHGIDYVPCHYNDSRLWFRGPSRPLRSPYVACLGGCGVYGRYILRPWPDLVEAQIGSTVVNLGVENGCVDAYLNDAGALVTAATAKVVVIELSGLHNTSNRFYATHPRRNDRFLKASSALVSLFPEMDFTEIHFTRHLLTRLHAICPERFCIVAKEVETAWQARMRSLIAKMNGDVYLMWFAPVPLADNKSKPQTDEMQPTRELLSALTPYVHRLVEAVPETWRVVDECLDVPPLEVARAAHLPGALAHKRAGDVVSTAIWSSLK